MIMDTSLSVQKDNLGNEVTETVPWTFNLKILDKPESFVSNFEDSFKSLIKCENIFC